MYMLASLTPSPELTGGPWYSDNELDLAFVEALKEVASRFLKQRGVSLMPTFKRHIVDPVRMNRLAARAGCCRWR